MLHPLIGEQLFLNSQFSIFNLLNLTDQLHPFLDSFLVHRNQVMVAFRQGFLKSFDNILQRTQIDEMPLVEVISRVNRIHRWTIRERLIAIAFLLVLAILSFIYWQVWQYGMGMIAFFILLWGGGLGLILWIYRKKFLNRIHEIKKNLSELNELM